jgi:hypothetical protein
MAEAPTTLGQLSRQRYRWSYGTMQQGVGKGVHPVEVMTRSPDQRWTICTLTSAINARPSNNLGLP